MFACPRGEHGYPDDPDPWRSDLTAPVGEQDSIAKATRLGKNKSTDLA
jgi:hypothetical protein